MKINIYRNYRFIDKDPILDALKTVVRDGEGLNNNRAAAITGIAPTTFNGWFDGGVRKPQNATATQVAAALGYVRRDELKEDGQVIVGYTKARKVDHKAEMKKQADWLLKQGKRRKPRKRNHANGKA